MSVRLTSLAFFDCVLRGIGQVMLQNNAWTGLLFVIGIACNAPHLAVALLAGAASSTATAMLSGIERAQVRDGLWGFNGGLVAVALLFFLKPGAAAWVCAIVAAAASTPVAALLLRLLKPWKLPVLTAPFIVTVWCFLPLVVRAGLCAPAQLPEAAALSGAMHVPALAEAVFSGIAQVFFQESVITGILFTLGLFVASRIAGTAALLGALAGALAARGMGVAASSIHAGLLGYNGALVAIALGGTFFAPGVRTTAYALLASVVASVASIAIASMLQPVGLPAMTLSFVLVTWLFLRAGPALGIKTLPAQSSRETVPTRSAHERAGD